MFHRKKRKESSPIKERFARKSNHKIRIRKNKKEETQFSETPSFYFGKFHKWQRMTNKIVDDYNENQEEKNQKTNPAFFEEKNGVHYRDLHKPETTKHANMKSRFVAAAIALCFLAGVLYTKGGIFSNLSEAISNAVTKQIPITCVQTDEKKIALTFDVEGDDENMEDILAAFEEHKAPATFFVTGEWVASYPETVKTIYEKGHELGNHSQSHQDMSKMDTDEIKQELQSVQDKVKELTEYEMKVFRSPYEDYSNELIEDATDLGMYCVQWNVDSLDWKDYGVDSIVTTVCNNEELGNGSIILMHNGAKYTVDALDALLSNLEEQGYEFVTVSNLLYTDNYQIDEDGCQIPDEE